MPNDATLTIAVGAMMRSPKGTWRALRHLRDGEVENGLQLLHDLAIGLCAIDWRQIEIDWLTLAAHHLTAADEVSKGNPPSRRSMQ